MRHRNGNISDDVVRAQSNAKHKQACRADNRSLCGVEYAALKNLNTSLARVALAISVLSAHLVSAQISAGTKAIYSIEFKPGTTTTVVMGTVSTPKTIGPDMTNEGSEQYSLRVRAGQHLTIQISSSNHQAMFTIIKPSPAGSKNEVVEKARGVKRWSGALAMNGDYWITVFTREEEGRFKLRVTLR